MKIFGNIGWMRSTKDFQIKGRELIKYWGKEADVVIPAGVASIGDGAFSGNKSVRTIRLPKTLRRIGRNAFSFCTFLEEVELPEGLTNIGDSTFYHCESLKKIEVPESVTVIGWSQFYQCNKLETLINHSKASILNCDWGYRTIINGYLPHEDLSMLGTKDKSLAVMIYLFNRDAYAEEKQAQYNQYIKRAGATLLKYYAEFDRLDAVKALLDTGLVTPKAVKRAVELVQGNVEVLAVLLDYLDKNVDMEEEQEKEWKELTRLPTQTEILKNLWNTKKNEDDTLTITGYRGEEKDLVVPSQIGKCRVTAIADYAFSPDNLRYKNIEWRRNGIKSVVVPEGTKTIGYRAFYQCEALEKLELPESIENIERYAFTGCHLLTIYAPKGCYAAQCAKRRGNKVQTI